MKTKGHRGVALTCTRCSTPAQELEFYWLSKHTFGRQRNTENLLALSLVERIYRRCAGISVDTFTILVQQGFLQPPFSASHKQEREGINVANGQAQHQTSKKLDRSVHDIQSINLIEKGIVRNRNKVNGILRCVYSGRFCLMKQPSS